MEPRHEKTIETPRETKPHRFRIVRLEERIAPGKAQCLASGGTWSKGECHHPPTACGASCGGGGGDGG